MRNMLKKYYKMNNDERSELKDLLLIHEIENKLEEYEDLELSIADEETIFEKVKTVSEISNIKDTEIITKILDILVCRDITIQDIIDITDNELIELITNNANDLKNEQYKILREFVYNGFYCVLVRDNEKYILIYDKNDISHVEIFETFEDMLCTIIDNKLSSKGENIV